MVSEDNGLNEIWKCIDNLDYDDNVKNLFIEALTFELKSNNLRYSNEYKKLLDRFAEDY